MAENGLLTHVRWTWDGTDTSADQVASDTVIQVNNPDELSVGDFIYVSGDGDTYEVLDITDDLITIAPGLVEDVPEGTTLVPQQGSEPGRIWVAEVLIAGNEEPIEVPLVWSDRLTLYDGPVDPPKPVTVTDDLQRIVDLPGQMPVINGTIIDPSTLPEAGGPTEEPASSPEIVVTGTAEGFVIYAEPVEPSTIIEYHMSTTEGFTPDATTLIVETRSNVVSVPHLPDGTSFLLDTEYFFKSVATNIVGSAPASTEVTAGLDPDAISEIVLSRVVAGIVMAGRFESGNGYWDPDEGIVLPQPDGSVTRLSTDGVNPSTISGYLIANGMTVKGDAVLYGFNQLSGVLEASAGVSDPGSEPTQSKSVPTVAHDEALFPYMWGLCQNLTVAGELVSLLSFVGSTQFRSFDKATGARDPFVFVDANIDGLVGGITALAGSYYVLGQRAGVWKVIAYDSSYVETGSWTVPGMGSPVLRPTIGNDGTNILIAHRSATAAPAVTVRNKTTGAQIGSVIIGSKLVVTDLCAVGLGTFDYGVTKLLVATTSNVRDVYVHNSTGTYDATLSWEHNADQPQGFAWDGTRFWGIDRAGRILKYSLHTQDESLSSSYTWNDTDSDNGTHETAESPDNTFTWPAREYVTVVAKPAPDADITDPLQVDKANVVRIYSGPAAGSRRLQATLAVGVVGYTFEVLNTGSAVAPTVTNFDTADTAPGVVRSAGEDGGGAPHWEFSGEGDWRLGPWSYDADTDTVASRDHKVQWFSNNSTSSLGNGAIVHISGGWSLVAASTTTDYVTESSGSFTFSMGGTYDVNASATHGNNTTGRRITFLYLNGSEVRRSDVGSGGLTTVQVSHILPGVEVGDVLTVRVFQSSGGNLAMVASPLHYLQISRRGD